MIALRQWFLARSRREQRLLLVMAALAIVVLVWAAIILPVTDRLAAARARYADAVDRLGTVEARVAALRAIRGTREPSLAGALDADLRARAQAGGIAPAQVEMAGARVARLSVASARAGALFGWIAGLEEAGLIVDTIAVTDNGDGTVAARLTIRVRG